MASVIGVNLALGNRLLIEQAPPMAALLHDVVPGVQFEQPHAQSARN